MYTCFKTIIFINFRGEKFLVIGDEYARKTTIKKPFAKIRSTKYFQLISSETFYRRNYSQINRYNLTVVRLKWNRGIKNVL